MKHASQAAQLSSTSTRVEGALLQCRSNVVHCSSAIPNFTTNTSLYKAAQEHCKAASGHFRTAMEHFRSAQEHCRTALTLLQAAMEQCCSWLKHCRTVTPHCKTTSAPCLSAITKCSYSPAHCETAMVLYNHSPPDWDSSQNNSIGILNFLTD